MKAIVLTRGRIATVDDEDFERVSQFKWCAVKTAYGGYYAAHRITVSPGRSKIEYLHQFLTGAKKTDHKNGDGLDNRRENLRPATNQQNMRSFQKKHANSTSQYRGVSWSSRRCVWEAQIFDGGRRHFLGYHQNEKFAAEAYDAAAKRLFGDFATPNFKT